VFGLNQYNEVMFRFILTVALGLASFCAATPLDISDYAGRPGVAEVAGTVIIRSGEFALALDKPTGRVVGLVDLQAKLKLDSSSSTRGLFTVGLSRFRSGERLQVPASAFRQVKVESRSSEKSAEVTARFSDAKEADLTVVCRFEVRPASPLVYATVQVENRSGWAIPWVDFPSVVLNPKIGDRGDDDVLLIPTLGGEMFKNPSAQPVQIPPENKSIQYPGYASYQMVAFFDNSAGLYLGTYDTEGNVKNFRAEMKGDGLDLTPRHQGPEVLNAGFRTDYPTVLGAIHGPWYNAADRYKEWALKQFWCRTKLADRTDVPDWLKSGPPFLLVYSLAKGLHAPTYQGDAEGLIEAIDLYRRTAGARNIMYTSGGWEHQGVWLGPYYFPTQPPEDWWKSFCEKALKRNIHVSLMTSGYKWTIKQDHPDGAPAFDFTEDFQRRSGMAITNPDGAPMFVGDAGATGFMGGTRSRICRGSKEGQDLMAGVFLRLAKIGVEMSSFDQDIGGGELSPCYNPNHNHPPGFGKWMWESYRDELTRILKEVHPYQPQFVMYQEDENELTIPWTPTSWTRDFRILDWQHFNAWGVPVFTYMYHQYASSIGAAVYHGSGFNPAPETRTYAMARCLAYGLHEGEFTSEIMMNGQGRPETLQSRAYFSYARPLSDHSAFLVLGTMLRPLELKCSNTRLPFRRRPPMSRAAAQEFQKARAAGQQFPGPAVQDFPLDLPAVVQGVFQAPDGRIGVILVNATDTSQQATLRLPNPYPGGRRLVREFCKGAEVRTHKALGGAPIELSMAPLEPVFLELD
jgi:hypothetical protein